MRADCTKPKGDAMNMHVQNQYNELLARHDEVTAMIHNIAIGNGTDAERAEYDRLICAAIPPGIYEHFKSTRENEKRYIVLSIGSIVDTTITYLISYTPLYLPDVGKFMYRPLIGKANGFLMPIRRGENKDRPEYQGSRFKLIRLMRPAGLYNIVDDAKAKSFPPS
jgi:hypothetical protein